MVHSASLTVWVCRIQLHLLRGLSTEQTIQSWVMLSKCADNCNTLNETASRERQQQPVRTRRMSSIIYHTLVFLNWNRRHRRQLCVLSFELNFLIPPQKKVSNLSSRGSSYTNNEQFLKSYSYLTFWKQADTGLFYTHTFSSGYT